MCCNNTWFYTDMSHCETDFNSLIHGPTNSYQASTFVTSKNEEMVSRIACESKRYISDIEGIRGRVGADPFILNPNIASHLHYSNYKTVSTP